MLKLLRGSKIDLYIGFWDNFQELMDTFSLLTEVRITSQYLHHGSAHRGTNDH